MNKINRSDRYMAAVIVAGIICVLWALANISVAQVDIYLLGLVVFTVAVGSRVTVKIPRFKSHISVSDIFIFLALLLYGGEIAVILAAVEAAASSWRFCNRKLTVFFNAATMAVSTSIVIVVLKASGLYTESQLQGQGDYEKNFIIALSVIALTQFLVNTSLASTHDALKDKIPLWETWKNKYIWTFFTYFIGAASAGLLVQIAGILGFGVIVATVPVIFFVFLSYRMYLKNVEISMQQTEKAEQYAKVIEERSVALGESEQRFRSAFNYAPIGIALVSPSGEWLKVNQALCDILGYDEQEFLATNFQSFIFSDDLGIALAKIHELLTGKISNYQIEQRYTHKTGRTVWASWSVSAASETKSEQSNLIFQFQDITGRKVAEEKLQHDATHDALTDLPNRSYFMGRLTRALKKVRTEPEYKASVMFIDLDRFKIVNDSLGHLCGDLLLKQISERLCDCMRPSDLVARIGGDEFTILVEGRYDVKEVLNIAERIQQKFSVPFDLNGHDVYSSASIGILHASENHLTSEDMMRDADTAMYQAKRAGKARHEVFTDNMHQIAKETLRLETDLRRAVENGDLTVHYQPIISLLSSRVEGVEALARWNHREFGDISPRKFIPIAEEIGIIDKLCEQVMRTACAEIGSLPENQPNGSSIYASINLSCKQFGQATLVTSIGTILAETRFSPRNLKLEITESVFLEYQEKAVAMLNQLNDFGIEINIDDFGTGYSNLSYLMQLPISALKIDRSFISMIDQSDGSAKLAQTIVLLARNMGLKVVAEGVETQEQLNELKQLNCESVQGFLFAKPMSLAQLRRFLSRNENLNIPKSQFEDLSVVSLVQ